MTGNHNSAEWTFGEHVRRRPGMYLGGLNHRGLLHCIDVIVTEPLRFAGAKISRVGVAIQGNLEVWIKLHGVIPRFDSGKGLADIPSSGFDTASDYAVVSAVSEKFEIIAVQDCRLDRASFTRGTPAWPRDLAATDEPPSLGVLIRFDSQLFPPNVALDYLTLCGRVQEWAIFNRNTRFVLEDHRDGSIRDYRYPDGLGSYLREIAFGCGLPPTTLNDISDGLFLIDQEIDGHRVEAVILGPRSYRHYPMIRSFVNGEQTVDHGSHVDGLCRAFSDSLREVDRDEWDWLARDGRDCLSGAEAILVAVHVREPHYAGSTKACLADDNCRRFVYEAAMRQLPDQLRQAIGARRAFELAE